MSSSNASKLLVNGVSASKVGVPANTQLTALDFLCARFPAVQREVWLKRFDEGRVLNAIGQRIEPGQRLLSESHLHYFREVSDEPTLPFKAQIIFQDAHLVVADKPHFMPVTPGGQYVQQSLLVQLKQQLNLPELSPIHRIDRETAGLVVFSVRAQDRDAYQALFRLREVDKTYEGIAAAPESSPLRLEFPLTHKSRMVEDVQFFRMRELDADEIQDGKTTNSETWIDCVDRLDGNASAMPTVTSSPPALARYVLKPITGQRHQLRVHMNALGLPLLGDQFYPVVKRAADSLDDFEAPLQLLAKTIAFHDPLTGVERRFESRRTLRLTRP
ncbi:pseudouridine synthase [Limnohabitans sp. 103DPR2]|uniref:pseudouridine synthase n=1 Tax=Limnohabitans sp. 103DPR2 TaxID=1678129 RepID=UPI0006DC8E1F|nr:pseudouridine synthase [Limnohabitans sp. 103DPR2]ALK92631.1 Ribosomal large subunit pseudouridine synthase A [Limnohabitans sp. 103DPR2]